MGCSAFRAKLKIRPNKCQYKDIYLPITKMVNWSHFKYWLQLPIYFGLLSTSFCSALSTICIPVFIQDPRLYIMGGGPLPFHIQQQHLYHLLLCQFLPLVQWQFLRHILDKVRLLLLNCAGCGVARLLPTLGLLIYQASRLLETWP